MRKPMERVDAILDLFNAGKIDFSRMKKAILNILRKEAGGKEDEEEKVMEAVIKL